MNIKPKIFDTTVTIKISSPMKEVLKEFAKGKPVSQVIREIVVEKLQEEKGQNKLEKRVKKLEVA